MGVLESYRLRLERKKWRTRALAKRRQLTPVADRTQNIAPQDTLLFCTIRNERIRLAYFLKYYRDLGIKHFLFVDNNSDDGTREYLAKEEDVSLWTTEASYKNAHFGADWMNWLLGKYGHDHWCLTVDADEFLVYPFCDTRPIQALTDWLDGSGIRSFSAMMIDMYPKGPIDAVPYQEGQNPFEISNWFDSGNYTYKRNNHLGEIWIQGGPRARTFFADNPKRAPAMNKIPLVKWQKPYTYISSTHMLLPRGLNLVYNAWGGEKTSGCLLHAKFIDTFQAKANEELERNEHYAHSEEYKAYAETIRTHPELWCKWSEKYINWRQLEILGLISKGNWA